MKTRYWRGERQLVSGQHQAGDSVGFLVRESSNAEADELWVSVDSSGLVAINRETAGELAKVLQSFANCGGLGALIEVQELGTVIASELTKGEAETTGCVDDQPLTAEEAALIRNTRREKRLKVEAGILRAHALEVAAGYAQWLRENGAGSTFSTFCNEYGYEDDRTPVNSGGVTRSAVFAMVEGLIGAANQQLQNIEAYHSFFS